MLEKAVEESRQKADMLNTRLAEAEKKIEELESRYCTERAENGSTEEVDKDHILNAHGQKRVEHAPEHAQNAALVARLEVARHKLIQQKTVFFDGFEISAYHGNCSSERIAAAAQIQNFSVGAHRSASGQRSASSS